jgi:hypothetical protein
MMSKSDTSKLPMGGRTEPVAQSDARAVTELERLIQLRLSPDNMLLELCISPGTRSFPMDLRVASVMQRMTAMGISPTPDEHLVQRALTNGKEKHWLQLAQGVPAVPSVPANLKVCVPSLPPIGRDRFRERACVRRGDILVRVTPARDGEAGYDLKGRELPSLPARQPTIPAGENTAIAEDEEGSTLAAACDGMVYFDRMKFSVQPMRIVTSRMLARGGKLETGESVFVPDGIPSGATLVAGGDIFVSGDVDQSTLISGGAITVLGCVTGHRQRHCLLQAPLDVMVASALYADVKSEQDVYIKTQARSCRIAAARHLILLTRLRSALYDTHIEVGGTVIPFDAPGDAPDVTYDERRAFDAACDIPAQMGVSGTPDITFHTCRIQQLSVGAASLALADDVPLSANKIVYLKFMLPGSHSVHILARPLGACRDGQATLAFRQMSHQDELAITAYCLSLARERVGVAEHDREQRARAD